jgi:endonuclease IV
MKNLKIYIYMHHTHYYQNMINDATDFVTRSVQTMNHELNYSTLKTI